jgi:hypothetical protein
MSGPQAPHDDGRTSGHQPVVEQLLGLATHPQLVDAALAAVRDLGVGSGAVRTIAGTMELHEELERRLAAFKHVEATLTFQSGFTANSGVIPTITGERDLIVSDELNHASIIDGVRLSKASRAVFPHRDVDGLERVLREARASGGPKGAYQHILVITDGVFSMDGDIAPLADICDVADRYEASVMIDDAHASGVLGRNGRGTVDHFDLHGRVDIQVGTLSKAIGALGGYVAGRSTCATTSSSERGRSSSRRRSHRPWRRPVWPPSMSSRRSRNGSRDSGRTPDSSKLGHRARLRHRILGTPITPVIVGPPTTPPTSASGCSSVASSRRRSSSRPWPSIGLASAPS